MKKAIFIIEKNGTGNSEFSDLVYTEEPITLFRTQNQNSIVFIKGDNENVTNYKTQAQVIAGKKDDYDMVFYCYHQGLIVPKLIELGINENSLIQFSYSEGAGMKGESYQKFYKILPKKCTDSKDWIIDEQLFAEHWNLLEPKEIPQNDVLLDPIKNPEKINALIQKILMP